MRELGLNGAHRGKRNRISIPNPQAAHTTGRADDTTGHRSAGDVGPPAGALA